MSKRRTKPTNPAQEWERAQERRRQHEDAVLIAAQPGHAVVSTTKERPHRRLDVFGLLLERNAITSGHATAVRRFEADALQGLPTIRLTDAGDRVQSGASAAHVTDQMLAARQRLNAAVASLGKTDGDLLVALIVVPYGALMTRWRDTVETITGETHAHAQTARVRAALDRLSDHYKTVDYGSRNRRAAA